MIKFEENGAINLKMYPSDYVVRDKNWWPIIIITHDEYIFFANNGIWRA